MTNSTIAGLSLDANNEELTTKAFTELRKIKSVTLATVHNGNPAARIIDLMLAEDNRLSFLTGRGKAFYHQLKNNPSLAIVGMGSDYIMYRVSGKIRFTDSRDELDRLFLANPVMNDLYPGEKRYILETFVMENGTGEIFDLSQTPPRRRRFSFGKATITAPMFAVNDNCIACGQCAEVCPVGAVTLNETLFKIDHTQCLECGACYEICPSEAITNQQSSDIQATRDVPKGPRALLSPRTPDPLQN
ncbi:4Fe-4S binding protein [Desulfovibrio ferrophilus]|uniref:4Fe-4S ferredoxin-type domain-containing protein n=1 Tax=Desulfovibrio ferrophilus TaxID=241368 RepID=A0A2Z6AVK2_9BACT|nr:4Fe-4S binding protein [Desulfovibrio ferrophilus]BBD07279.1 uncharacterized protein DFE_0553 [Desulfovibrio ferrophilus]